MKNITRRITAVIFAAVILFMGLSPVIAEGEDFDAFMTGEWKKMMEYDYLSMHFSVKDYRSMGLTKPELTLGKISYEEFENEVSKKQASLEQLHSFDYSSLNDTQQHDYLVFERFLEDQIALNSYPDLHELFNPYTGNVSNYQTIFTEFVFYEKEDIDDYLVLLADYPRYCNEMLAFTQKQAEKGYFMLDSCLDLEKSELQKFIDTKEDNPFIVIFNNNVDAFEGLTDEERTAYKEKNRDIVLNQIIPEYESLSTELEKLRGKRAVQDSLYHYPNGIGKDYYTALVRSKIGSNASMQEAFDYLSKACNETMKTLVSLMLASGMKEPEKVSGFDSPEAILKHLENNLQNFPKGPEVNYTPSYLDPSIANPNVMAYYLVCPVDDVRDNVIRINGDLANEDFTTLYETLTHEGFPGHLYQFTYYLSSGPNPIRHDLSVIGYQEGWAQYVIRDLMLKSGLSETDAKISFLNSYFGYAANAAVDIAVNGLGYNVEQLGKWMKDTGLQEEAAQELYDTVIQMPGQILPYGYGQMKFLEYRERMITTLGEDFDEVEFHRLLLDHGPRQFEVVESDLGKYCESKGKTFTKEFTFFQSEGAEDLALKSASGMIKKFLPYIIGAIVVIGALVIGLIILIVRMLTGKKKNQDVQ